MHELSLAMSIMEVAEEQAQRNGGARVEVIYLKVGALAGVVSEALLSAYELARTATPFETCRLEIEEVPVVIYCSKCQAERTVTSLQWFCCVECDTPGVDVRSGRELQVSALELAE